MAKLYLILVLFGSLSWAPLASAQPTPVPAITIAEVINLLTAQGFHDISKVEFDFDDNHYEIDAVNPNNEKVEIEMTGTGQFISIEKV